MNTTVINVKTDKQLKVKAQKIAKEMGLSLGTIINHSLRELVQEKRVVFSVPLVPNKKTERLIREVEKDIRLGRNISPSFTNGEEMDRYLAKV